jgi:hypothetical protein
VRSIFVHIAGKPHQGVQECSRCGFVLLDHSETRRVFFTVGAFVVSDGNSLVAQRGDATGSQIACEAVPVNVPERGWKR